MPYNINIALRTFCAGRQEGYSVGKLAAKWMRRVWKELLGHRNHSHTFSSISNWRTLISGLPLLYKIFYVPCETVWKAVCVGEGVGVCNLSR